MRQVEPRDIGGVTYHITQAPAVEQKTLLTLVGAKVTFNSSSSGVEKIDTRFLKGVLLSMQESTLDRIAEIVLYKCVPAGGDERVTIDNFQGSMNDWLTLIAEGVAINLDDFFTWLDDENARVRAEIQRKTSSRTGENRA